MAEDHSHSRRRDFDVEDAQNLNQIMGALKEIKIAAQRYPNFAAMLSYDVHIDSTRAKGHLRTPHMARGDCNCQDDR